MNADKNRDSLNAITGKLIGCASVVANSLGSGFLEKVCEVEVRCDGILVGAWYAGLLVEGPVPVVNRF